MTSNEKYQKLYDDIVENKMTIDEVKELFNSYQFYIPKDDFGTLISDLIGEVDFSIIREILMSRKGKLYDDYKDGYGEPIVHILILQTTLHKKFEEMKEGLFNLLEDDEVPLKWGTVNNNLENTLHIICFLSNYYTKDDFIRLLNILKKHNFNPLNRDDLHRNAIEVFKLRNPFSKSDVAEIVNMLEEMTEQFTIEVNNYVEEETEVEEEVTVSAEC